MCAFLYECLTYTFLYKCLTYTFLYKCLTYTFPSPACAGLFCVRILDRPANKNALRETKARYGKPRHATGNQGGGRLRGACAWYVIICRARWNPYKNNGIVVKQPDFSVEYQRVVSTQAQRARRVQPIEKIDVVLYTYNIYVCMCVNTFSKMT